MFDEGVLEYGEQGEVMGPSTGANEGCLDVKFPNNKGNVACKIAKLSRLPVRPYSPAGGLGALLGNFAPFVSPPAATPVLFSPGTPPAAALFSPNGCLVLSGDMS